MLIQKLIIGNRQSTVNLLSPDWIGAQIVFCSSLCQLPIAYHLVFIVLNQVWIQLDLTQW
jgi:hypothetical protein